MSIPNRFSKNQRYFGEHECHRWGNTIQTFCGKPYNRFEWKWIKPLNDIAELPEGIKYRSKSRIVYENPIDILSRGEEIISETIKK